MMEVVRIIFYYFARGFTVDTVWKELSSFLFLEGGRLQAKQIVMGMFSFIRGVISDRTIRDLKKQKLGGPGTEVWMDCYKLNLKTGSNVEEFWIIGFIENESQRSRAYLTNDVKIDSVALFIAKTVAKHSTLCTPYYHQVGWEWLDKFYDHQRLRRDAKKKCQGQRTRRD